MSIIQITTSVLLLLLAVSAEAQVISVLAGGDLQATLTMHRQEQL